MSLFRNKQGLSSSEAINLKSLLLKLNILVLFRPLSESFSGMCLKGVNGYNFMLINSSHTKGRQHFTIAHELYHLYIEDNPKPHRCNAGTKSKDYNEQCADLFASLLLMPKDAFFELLTDDELQKDGITVPNMVRLEQYFGVSRSALLYRLLNLELISEGNYLEYLNQINRNCQEEN